MTHKLWQTCTYLSKMTFFNNRFLISIVDEFVSFNRLHKPSSVNNIFFGDECCRVRIIARWGTGTKPRDKIKIQMSGMLNIIIHPKLYKWINTSLSEKGVLLITSFVKSFLKMKTLTRGSLLNIQFLEWMTFLFWLLL